jgi:hypothetical protein
VTIRAAAHPGTNATAARTSHARRVA